MKNPRLRFLNLLSLSAMIIFIASCSAGSDQMKMIPDDAFVVLTVDPGSVISKAEFGKEGNSFTKILQDAAKNNVPDIFNEILKEPSKAPISLTDDMFIFVSNSYAGFTAKVKNADDMKKILKEMDIDDFRNKDKYMIAIFDRSSIGIWDKDKFLFVNAMEYDKRDGIVEYGESLFTQKKDRSIVSRNGFNDFFGKKKDISVWFCYDNLPADARKELRREIDWDLSETEMGFFLDFEKGQTKLEANLLKTNDGLKKKIKELNYSEGKISGDLLKYLPEQSIISFAGSLNGEKLYNFLSGVNEREVETAGRELRSEGVELKDILASFKGDVVFNLYDVKTVSKPSLKYNFSTREYERVTIDSPFPLFTVLAKTKDDYALNSIVKLIKSGVGDTLVEKEGNTYLTMIDGVRCAFGSTGKYVFFTTDELAVNDIKNGYQKSLADTELKKGMTKSFGYGYMGLNFENYPPVSRRVIEEYIADEFDPVLASMLSKRLNSVRIYSTSETSAELVLKYADQDKNSAAIITETIADILKKFM